MKTTFFTLLTVASMQLFAQLPTNGLIADYPFSGNANDFSGSGNNGTITGATLNTDRFGNSNSAYYFNGSSNIRIKRTIQDDFTISVWVKSTLSGTNCGYTNTQWHCGYGIVDADNSGCTNDFGISINNGKFDFGIGSSTCGDERYLQSNNSFNDNNWHHIVAVRSLNSIIELYVDNILVTTTTSNGMSLTDPSKITFGAMERTEISPNTIFRNFKGLIDDIKIYNRALSQSEITSLYTVSGVVQNTTLTGPIADYPFSGNANDVSGNGKNGAVNGALLTTDRFGNANSAYNFDGSGQNIVVNNLSLPAGDFSLSFWYNTSVTNRTMRIMEHEWITNNFGVFTTALFPTNNAFEFDYRNTNDQQVTVSKNQISNLYNNWNHLVCIASQNISSIYLNGILISTVTGSSAKAAVKQLLIGSYGGSGFPYQGSIDDIKIYNRAISQSEITSLYSVAGVAQNSTLTGPVADYPFTGNANDVSGNNINGTVVGATLTADRFGNLNSAYSFNGIDNTITFTGVPTTNVDNWAMSAWINPNSLSQLSMAVSVGYDDGVNAPVCNGYSFGIGNGFNQTFLNGNKLTGLFCNIAFYNTNYAFNSTTNWYHIVMQRSAGVTKFYVNGTILGFSTSTTPYTPNFFQVGSQFGLRYFNGKIDDIKIYNRALSQSEITTLYTVSGVTQITTLTGPIADYPFTGNANDVSGNGNNGTLVGGNFTSNNNSCFTTQVLSLNGINSYVKYNWDGKIGNGKNSFSIALQFKTSSSNPVRLISNGINGAQSGYSIFFNGSLAFGMGDELGTGSSDFSTSANIISTLTGLNDNNWHSVIVTVDRLNNRIKLYIDGNKTKATKSNGYGGTITPDGELDISSLNNISSKSSFPLVVGSLDRSTEFFKGLISNLKIYDRAITSSEVSSLVSNINTCTSGPIADYPFIGNANDVSGNGNNGSVNGATLTTDRFGNANSAYNFNGIDNVITVNGTNFNFISNMSIAFWVKPGTSQKDYAGILDKTHSNSALSTCVGSNWVIQQNGSSLNDYYYSFINSCDNSIPNVPEGACLVTTQNNKWDFITYVKSNKTIKWYKNGVLVSTYDASSYDERSNTSPLWIGGVNTYDRYFNGSIDDIKIYNRAISQAEITSLFTVAGVTQNTTLSGPIADFPFNGNGNDVSGNGNNGTVVGATLTTDRFGNPNSAYSFNGNSNYIFAPKVNSPISTFSVWFYPYSIPQYTSIVYNGNSGINGHGLTIEDISYLGGSGNILKVIAGSINGNLVNSNYTISGSKWTNAVIVKNYDNFNLYVDGVLVHTGTSTSNNPSEYFYIGKGFNNFNGKIDDIKIYDRAISQAEVTALYNATTTGGGVLTEVKDKTLDAGINIYPNPTAGIFTVNAAEGNTIGFIEVYNNVGTLVQVQQGNTINITGQPSGIYNVLLKDIANTYLGAKKIIKQ